MIPGTVSVAAESCYLGYMISPSTCFGVGADTTYGAQGNRRV
jgi:hypothetical protein